MNEKSMLYALYYGAVSPWDSNSVATHMEYNKAVNKMFEAEAKVVALLGEEGKLLYEELLESITEMDRIYAQAKFEDGFIIGSRLMIETFTDQRFTK